MANIWLNDATLRRLKEAAQRDGYKVYYGPRSQLGDYVAHLLDLADAERVKVAAAEDGDRPKKERSRAE